MRKKLKLGYVYICKTEKAVTRVKMSCVNNGIKHTVVNRLGIVITEKMVPLRVCNDISIGIICEIPVDKEVLCGKKK